MHLVFPILLILYIIASFKVAGEQLELSIAVLSDAPQQNLFFHELLTTALENDGHSVKLNEVAIAHFEAAQKLKSGAISIFWMLESKQRDDEFIGIEAGLTNGLIGKRVLLIRRSEQQLFKQIRNIEDLRQLDYIAGLGKDWFDVKIWEANNLPYETLRGNWQIMFEMFANNYAFDYLPRGINEITDDADNHAELMIEQNLVFIYDLDMKFYLSLERGEYQLIIQKALTKADKDGLINALVNKHWSKNIEKLNYDKRIQIKLEVPLREPF
ncbi:hypothetical protein AADZ86_00145 [Colwelliaceae bacterium BS250]